MKTIFCLLTIVLSATLLYAANGDLIVNGHIGVGPTIQPRSGIYVASTITAVSHQAQGISLVDLNLTAAANNDVLAGIRISPTFTTPQGLTGVKTFGLYVNSLANNFFAGNVGIGTIGPNTALDVEAAPVVNGADRAVLSLGDTTAMAADVGGGLQFVGKYANSGGAAEWAGIKSGKANGTDGDYGAYMAFMTRTNGSATAERMRIDSSGNVGIGTPGPGAKLDIQGGTTGVNISNVNGGGGIGYGLHIGNSITGNAGSYAFASDSASYSYFTGPVGIGNTLDVSGTIHANTGFAVGSYTGFSSTIGNGCGNVYVGGILTTFVDDSGCDGDMAEYFGTQGDRPERGDIVALADKTNSFDLKIRNPAPGETNNTGYTVTTANLEKATAKSRNLIIGVVPTSPGQILGSKEAMDKSANPQLLALSGHIPVKMTLDGGDIKIGDPITVSASTPGAGMKATTSGRIIGYALAPFAADSPPESGMIEVLVALGDWVAPQDIAADHDNIARLKADNETLSAVIKALTARVEALESRMK